MSSVYGSPLLSNLILFLNNLLLILLTDMGSVFLVFRRHRSINWIGPLVSILLFQLFLYFVSSLHEGVEKINVFQVRVKIFLRDFKFVKESCGEIILGDLRERELMLEDLDCGDLVLTEVICGLTIIFDQFVSELRRCIKVFL